MATYPLTQQSLLSNGVIATTVVSIKFGMQTSTTTFTGAAGDFGKITLSPTNDKATNVQMASGHQKLFVSSLIFRAAFGVDTGQVTAAGSATDQNGNDPVEFNKQICQWSND